MADWEAFRAEREASRNGRGPTLRLYGPDELGDPPPLRPLIRGVVAAGTFGPLGGAKKTLKSYLALSLGSR